MGVVGMDGPEASGDSHRVICHGAGIIVDGSLVEWRSSRCRSERDGLELSDDVAFGGLTRHSAGMVAIKAELAFVVELCSGRVSSPSVALALRPSWSPKAIAD